MFFEPIFTFDSSVTNNHFGDNIMKDPIVVDPDTPISFDARPPLDPALFAPAPTEDLQQGKQEIEAELSGSLHQLDLQERERALDDLHGITIDNSHLFDDPNFIQQSLAELDERLNKIKHGTAIELAERLDFAYVADTEMRLMFLRSCDFDITRAAEKIRYFFDVKRECFGVQNLTKEITLQDLNPEEEEFIKSGTMQVLPFKDMSGRDIILLNASLRTNCSIENEDRAKFFILMEYVKKASETNSRLTLVYFGLDAAPVEVSRFVGIWFAMPLRVSGIHMCTASENEMVRDCYALVSLPARSKARTRVHIGTYTQCHASLAAYGIPSHLLPVKNGDSPTMSHHVEWYNQLEASATRRLSLSSSTVSSGGYTEKDVLFGHKRNHSGNSLMRKLVEMHQEAYDISPKAGKVKLAREIVEQIQKAGGRFLRRDEEGEWVEVSNEKARDKVAHTFRNLRRTSLS